MNRFKKLLIAVVAVLTVSFTQGQPVTTLQNLQKAYQAEANASRRYELYAQKASKEGYNEVAHLFRAVSKSEAVHMQNHKDALEKLGGNPNQIIYEKVKVGTTKENLKGPIEGEKNETESLYPDFKKTAEKEKATPAVQSFSYAMKAEGEHEKLFQNALSNLGKNKQEDYYVSDKTGETIEVAPSASAPKPAMEGERFVKVN